MKPLQKKAEWKKQENWYYKTKHKDENYDKKYLEKLKHEWTCDGRP